MIRGTFSIAVLSAFVLLIAFIVSVLWNTDAQKFAKNVSSLFSKININVDEKKVGDVAGEFVERISNTNLGSGVSDYRGESQDAVEVVEGTASVDTKSPSQPTIRTVDATLKIAVISDIHEDYDNLATTIRKIKQSGIQRLILLGDLTNFGDKPALTKIKTILDASGLEYYALPGDHDIAQSLNDANFLSVFGKSSQKITIENVTLLLLDNSANFTVLPAERVAWFKQALESADIVLLSQPLYSEGLNEPFSMMYMGSTKTPVSDPALMQKQEQVLTQGKELLSVIRSSTTVKAIIAGDLHKSSKLPDPINNNLEHYVVGAVSSKVDNFPQAAIQTSRFSVMTVTKDGKFTLEDLEL